MEIHLRVEADRKLTEELMLKKLTAGAEGSDLRCPLRKHFWEACPKTDGERQTSLTP